MSLSSNYPLSVQYQYIDGSSQYLPPLFPDGYPLPHAGDIIEFGSPLLKAEVVRVIWDLTPPTYILAIIQLEVV